MSAPLFESFDFTQVQGNQPPEPESPGLLRHAADTGLQLAQGVLQGGEMLANTFGADNQASRALRAGAQWLASNFSDQLKWEQLTAAQDARAAELSGSTWEEIKAAARAVGADPVGFIANAAGTTLPTIAAAFLPGGQGAVLGRLAATSFIGAAQGAGSVKGQIYGAVEDAWKKDGASDEEAQARATAAQEYFSSSAGQIALGGALGAVAGGSGLEAGILARRAFGAIGQKTATTAAIPAGSILARGAARIPRFAKEAVKEALPEGAQGGQEQLAANLALQNEGFDQTTFGGVAGATTLEALAGAGVGAAASPLTSPSDAQRKAADAALDDLARARTADDAINAAVRAVDVPLDAGPQNQSATLHFDSPEAGGPSATVVGDMPFSDRVLTIREQLADEKLRESIRAAMGDDVLNEALYYAAVANTTGDRAPPQATRERMLSVAEAIVDRVRLQVQPQQPARIGADPAPQGLTFDARPLLPLDESPSGVMRADAQGIGTSAVPKGNHTLADLGLTPDVIRAQRAQTDRDQRTASPVAESQAPGRAADGEGAVASATADGAPDPLQSGFEPAGRKVDNAPQPSAPGSIGASMLDRIKREAADALRRPDLPDDDREKIQDALNAAPDARAGKLTTQQWSDIVVAGAMALNQLAPAPEKPRRNSEQWRNEGKTPDDLRAEKVQSLASELAGQIAFEASANDFAPNEIPAAVQQWAKDANVPADELRQALLKEVGRTGISDARKLQVRRALDPTRAPAAPAAPAGDLMAVGGKPYGTKAAATIRARKEGGEVVEVPGGWVVRPAGAAQPASDVPAQGAPAEAENRVAPRRFTIKKRPADVTGKGKPDWAVYEGGRQVDTFERRKDAQAWVQDNGELDTGSPSGGNGQAGGIKHPRTIMGSRWLAAVSRYLGGLDPAWIAEFSVRVQTSKIGKDGRPLIIWRNPPIPGVGPLFRAGGTQDLQELAELAEAEGYLDPGSVEADTKEAGERAKEMVRKALERETLQTTYERDAEIQAARDAEMAEYYAELDRESAAELEAEREAIVAEAELTNDGMAALIDSDLAWDTQGDDDQAALMRALGFTEQEIADELADKGPRADQEEAAGVVPARPGEGRAAASDRGPAPRNRGQEEDADQVAGADARSAKSPTSRPDDVLTPQTPADLEAKAEREGRADELDQRAQIDREVDLFGLQSQTTDTREDTTGDMFGGPTADDARRAADRQRAAGAVDGGGSLFDADGAAAERAEDQRRADADRTKRAKERGALMKRIAVLRSLLDCVRA